MSESNGHIDLRQSEALLLFQRMAAAQEFRSRAASLADSAEQTMREAILAILTDHDAAERVGETWRVELDREKRPTRLVAAKAPAPPSPPPADDGGETPEE